MRRSASGPSTDFKHCRSPEQIEDRPWLEFMIVGRSSRNSPDRSLDMLYVPLHVGNRSYLIFPSKIEHPNDRGERYHRYLIVDEDLRDRPVTRRLLNDLRKGGSTSEILS